MTSHELVDLIREHCPNATVGEDMDGQAVIYTDMRMDKEDNLIKFKEDEA
tara:strand:+ start:1472 stop:1621 length:150 start_codon:yes stop_codon:yes gene_type:complete